ncbi:MAG: DUF167 domain-containing protein [Myxococcaceae bacterium]
MPLPGWLRTMPDGVELSVYVQPRASRTKLVGEHDGALKVQVAAPPVDGEANAELSEFLADLFSVPKRQVEIASGDTGRRKRIRISGVSAEQALLVMKAG